MFGLVVLDNKSGWLAWLHLLCCRDTSRLQLDATLHTESNIESAVRQRAVGNNISHEDDDEKNHDNDLAILHLHSPPSARIQPVYTNDIEERELTFSSC
ncbi:acrosin-like [Tachysurus ichikawai]